MALAIFDLDHTLINGDSDHAWGEFLLDREIVDAEHYRRMNDSFHEDYKRGELDILTYLKFALQPLSQFSLAELAELHEQFMQAKIEPMLQPKAQALIDKHRDQGDELLIITATNRFVTEPIAKRMGIDNLLASEPEMRNGRYTGQPTGIPCYQEGKVERLKLWLEDTGQHLAGSFFYSDSHNDIPLLKQVDNPVVVDPDNTLRGFAEDENWPCISLRD